MVSVVGQNGNVKNVAELVTDQVDIQDVNTRANANRLSQRLRSLKGHLTRKVKCCTQKIEQLRTMLDASQSTSQMMVEYARNMLNNFICCQTRQAEIEKGIVDLVQLRTEVWDINDETGLEAFISEQDTESELYYTKVKKIRSENLVIFKNVNILDW